MYIIVSQGMKIAEFPRKEMAVEYCNKLNKEWLKYYQSCLDIGELPADNRCSWYYE